MGSVCASATSSTVTNTPSAQTQAQQGEAFYNAQQAAGTPYTAYDGQLVAPLNQGQRTAIGQLQGSYGLAQPYMDAGSQYISQGAQGLANVQNYLQAGAGAAANSSNYLNSAAGAYGQSAAYGQQSAQALAGMTPYMNSANSALGQAGTYYGDAAGYAAPVQFSQAALQQYMNPYTQDVINSTMKQLNQNDQVQTSNLVSNSIGSGAYGGDRNGIAVAALAGQQDLSNNQTVAGLNQANYQQAVGQFNQEQADRYQTANIYAGLGSGSLQQAAGYGNLATQQGQMAQQYGNLGTLSNQTGAGYTGLAQTGISQGNLYNTLGQLQGTTGAAQGNLGAQAGYLGSLAQGQAISGASAGLQGSTLQQALQQQQDTANYGQYQLSQQYPFYTSGFLANIANGQAATGGSSATTNGSLLSAATGLGTLGLGILGATGGTGSLVPSLSNLGATNANGGRVVERAHGGPVGLGHLAKYASGGAVSGLAGLGGINIMRQARPMSIVPHSIKRVSRPHFDDGGLLDFAPAGLTAVNAPTAVNPTFAPIAITRSGGGSGTGNAGAAGVGVARAPNSSAGGLGILGPLTNSGASATAAPPVSPDGNFAGTATPSDGLSKNASMGLIAAGLGMMGGSSGNGIANIGQGGLEGLKTYLGLQQQDRQNAVQQQEMGFKKQGMDIDQQRVNQGAAQLAQAAQFHKDELANQQQQVVNQTATTQANVAATKADTAMKMQTVTPAGIMQRDPNNPYAPPKFIPWDAMTSGSSAPQSAPQGASPVAVPPAAAALPGSPVAPAAAVAQVAPQPQSAYQGVTDPPQQIPVNPQRINPTYEQDLHKQTGDVLATAQTAASAARSTQMSLAQMQEALNQLPPSGFLAAGPGQQQRAAIAGQTNTILRGLGVSEDNLVNPNAVASSEELKKLTNRMGFDLAKSLGGREPGFIVQQAVGSVPSSENSPMGAQRLMAGLGATAQRQIDYNSFMQKWAAKTGGDITGADDYFNKVNPPQGYAAKAVVSTLPPDYVTRLKQAAANNPAAASFFDKRFGKGTAALVLGSQPQ